MIMNNKLDIQTAYAAMYEFLVGYYERTKSGDVGALLGSMSRLDDGKILDPAVWQDWLESIEKAKKQEVDQSLGLKPKRN